MATVSATTDVADANVAELRAAMEAIHGPRQAGETVQQFLNRVWRRFLVRAVREHRQRVIVTDALNVEKARIDTDYGTDD